MLTLENMLSNDHVWINTCHQSRKNAHNKIHEKMQLLHFFIRSSIVSHSSKAS